MPDLATTFFKALSTALQERLAKKIPDGPPDYQSNYNRLTVMKNLAEEEERAIKQIVEVAGAVHRPRIRHHRPAGIHQAAGSAGTFMAAAGSDTAVLQGQTKVDCCKVQGADGRAITIPKMLMPDRSGRGSRWASFMALCLATQSQVEEALQEASGTTFPR
eukprot:9450272-Ditylum_brightwellii.AAC.1